jgi:hypothetical protein
MVLRANISARAIASGFHACKRISAEGSFYTFKSAENLAPVAFPKFWPVLNRAATLRSSLGWLELEPAF